MTDRSKAIRWRAPRDGGVEHCALKITDRGITAEGVVIGGAGETAYGLRYRITADAEWVALRSLHLTLLGGPTVALRHDGFGEWTDGEGRKREDFSGLFDVDIAGTPLGIVTTIRRQAWKAGRAVELDVVAIALPSLAIERAKRRITAVEPGRLYRLGVGDDGPEAEIALDEEGLPLRWADRFERPAD